MSAEALSRKEHEELDFWRQSPHERPGSDSLPNMLNKFGDARRFWLGMERYSGIFGAAHDVLELGGGQGWASALLKRRFPQARVHTSDLSPDAVQSVHLWERVFDVHLDGAFPCRSYAIPANDASYDVVFAFAAAHHFIAHRRTLIEIHRVLRPGGRCLYLYEPTSPAMFRPVMLARARRIQKSIPEDIIVPDRLLRVAREVGFTATVKEDLALLDRGVAKALYYCVLIGLPPLRRFMPCTRDFLFTKGSST